MDPTLFNGEYDKHLLRLISRPIDHTEPLEPDPDEETPEVKALFAPLDEFIETLDVLCGPPKPMTKEDVMRSNYTRLQAFTLALFNEHKKQRKRLDEASK